MNAVVHTLRSMSIHWLRVLGTTETPLIDHGVGHQFHPVVPLLDVPKTEQQPFEFVLLRKGPFYPIPQCMDGFVEQPLAFSFGRLAIVLRIKPAIEVEIRAVEPQTRQLGRPFQCVQTLW